MSKLTIRRISSIVPSEHNKIEIEVKDGYNDTIAKVKVSAQDFTHALTGMVNVPCEVETK